MQDILLHKMFEMEKWRDAIAHAVEKDMDRSLLREMSSPETRIELYRDIRDGRYKVAPPHEAQIPKDDGSMRTVYVNENVDRIVLSIINDMLFELCPEMVHERCGSYQKGIGCGKLVKEMASQIGKETRTDIGVKVDLSKYFDSVPIELIDGVFDSVEDKFGESAVIRILREYYHNDTVLDLQKNKIEKYSSLRQGCAVAAFLADAVLYDIDKEISGMEVSYVRYSDDILIIGEKWKDAFQKLSAMLSEKGLTLNPKKVEFLDKDRWFSFLGFMIKGGQITLSPGRVKTFQKEMLAQTVKKGIRPIAEIITDVNRYLYKGSGSYSWATSVLPIMTVEKDINELNGYAMDAIRAAATGRKMIGGIGASKDGKDHAIMRGRGRDVKSNKDKIPVLPGWRTILCMMKAMKSSRSAYEAIITGM